MSDEYYLQGKKIQQALLTGVVSGGIFMEGMKQR